jgi:hypothetical protein
MPQASMPQAVVAASATAAADDKVMQPTEGKKGATIPGPRDPARANEKPDQRFTNCQTPDRITVLQLQL